MRKQEAGLYPTLGLSPLDRVRRTVGHSAISRGLSRAIIAPRSPNFVKLEWFSDHIDLSIPLSITVDADPYPPVFAKNRDVATVIATTDDEIESIHERAGRGRYLEAVASITGDDTRIGIRPKDNLFRRLDGTGDPAVAFLHEAEVREVTMGLWLPGQDLFVGANDIQLVHNRVHVSSFSPGSSKFSDIRIAG
jgi:hypothetical protein